MIADDNRGDRLDRHAPRMGHLGGLAVSVTASHDALLCLVAYREDALPAWYSANSCAGR